MNWKAAVLLFALFFASGITTVAISLSAPNLSVLSASGETLLNKGFEPMGDPIDCPGHPN